MSANVALLIPMLALSIPIVAIWTKHQRQMARIRFDGRAGAADEIVAQQAERTRELEDRVRVLERIVTDKGYDVASQIEALRDARSVDDRMLEAGRREKVQ